MEQVVAQQRDVPVFAIYADESSKTQEHFAVSNVWFPYAVDLAFLTLGIQCLKKNYGFKRELHFTETNSTKLPFYKRLAVS